MDDSEQYSQRSRVVFKGTNKPGNETNPRTDSECYQYNCNRNGCANIRSELKKKRSRSISIQVDLMPLSHTLEHLFTKKESLIFGILKNILNF